MLRRAVTTGSTTTLTLALAVGLVAGCSGSGSGSGGGTSQPKPTAAAPALTVTEATAAAAAINLTAADLPGYTGKPAAAKTAQDKADAAAFAHCYGGVDPALNVLDVASDDFAKGQALSMQQVSSSVAFVRTAAEGHQDLTAVQSPAAAGCVKDYVGKAVASAAGKDLTVASTEVAPLTPAEVAASGTDGAFGYRITVTAKASGLTVPFYVDLLGCLKGRTETTLTVLSVQSPFPTADRDKLWQLLAARTADKAV